ncbi:MAG: TlpA disulfide reductase family protein [Hyphomicrobiales bacterium]
MTDRSDQKPKRLRFLVPAAIAGALAGLGAVYVMDTGKGNPDVATKVVANGSCPAVAGRSERLKDLVKGEIAALSLASAPVPLDGLVFAGPDGAEKTLADFKGRAVLLNLWATWCPPCRAEMPSLDRLEGELGSEAFEVVTVNIDTRDPEKPKKFFEEIAVQHLTRYADPTAAIFKDLRGMNLAFGMPTTLVVDADGCLVGHMAGGAEWDSGEAKALLGEIIGERRS